MKYPDSSRRIKDGVVRLVGLTLCAAVVLPYFAVTPLCANAIVQSQDLSRTSVDGKRQISSGPYVPPALRTDNGDRRANGRTGKQVAPLAANRVAPASNLPNLTESRKTRTSPITAFSSPAKSESVSAAQITDSAAFQQIGLPCGDCD